MKRGPEPDAAALIVLTLGLLTMGHADERIAPDPVQLLMVEAGAPASVQEFPEAWIREFDRKRERLLERLDGKMNDLRRKLERRQGRAKVLLAICG